MTSRLQTIRTTKRKKFIAVLRVNGINHTQAWCYNTEYTTKEEFEKFLQARGIEYTGIQTINCY